jgi:hypothetical protein
LRLFFGATIASIFVIPQTTPIEGWPLISLLLLAPIGSALGLYFWPRNLDGLRLTEAMEQNREKIIVNGEEGEDARRRLMGINSKPAHLSAIAFVAATLQAHRLDSPEIRNVVSFTRGELLALGRAGVTRLSDLNTDLSFALDETKCARLLAFKQMVMDTAKESYQNLTEERRELQIRVDRLETERQGLLAAESELHKRARDLGDATFSRFLMRLFGM